MVKYIKSARRDGPIGEYKGFRLYYGNGKYFAISGNGVSIDNAQSEWSLKDKIDYYLDDSGTDTFTVTVSKNGEECSFEFPVKSLRNYSANLVCNSLEDFCKRYFEVDLIK